MRVINIEQTGNKGGMGGSDAIWPRDGIESKHNVYRGEYCMKTFLESL